MWEFHHIRAFPRKVQVANLTSFSTAQLLMWNTDSIFSNHCANTTTPSVPLKVKGWQFRKSFAADTLASISCSTSAAVIRAVAAAAAAVAVAVLTAVENYQRPRDHLHESDLKPEVPESVLEPMITIPVCESCMTVAHSELLPLNVPKPLEKLEPPNPTVVQSHGETVYPRSIPQLFVITESICPEHPRSQHKYPECPALAPQEARSL
ncbi:hypothetical protein Tco_0780173 [Tanacetum coccineum]